MGNYSLPESIRNLKPKGTMVKKIHGRYYVYEYACRKDEDGKWKTVMGKQIGSITSGLGFIPNSSSNADDETTTLEHGQYALVFFNSKTILDDLMAVFNPVDACHIYLTALIHFVNSFVRLKDAQLTDSAGRIVVFRDINENAIECENYMKHLSQGRKGFSMEEYRRISPYFGVIVLQTNVSGPPSEVCSGYKNRWQIETFYNCFKNDIDYNALGIQDYYII